MIRRLRLCIPALALGFALAPRLLAQAQATTGIIEGIVLDPEGAIRPGASVTVTNTATNFTQSHTTDGNGRFRALQLPLGPYRVTVALAGFATLVREGITLSVGQTVSLTLRLEVSGVQQEVSVSAEAPVIATSRTEGTTIIPQQAVAKLPEFNHNYLEFTKLTPGVSVVQGPDAEELTINGQKGIQNNVSVDGADFNNPFFGEQRGGTRPPFTFNLDSVQEVVVVADGANAEFGRSSSGFVNVVTKSGTNDIHGSAHGYYTDDSLAAKAPQPGGGFAPKPDSQRYQVGFTFGGPAVQDKLFYFLSADYQNGDSTKQLDPNRIEQRVVDAFAGLGSPDENGPIARTDDALALLAKVDWRASDQHLLTLRYVYTWANQENGTFDVDSWGRSANAIEKVFSRSGSGTFLSTFTAGLSNEFRFQFAREDRPRPYNGPTSPLTGRPLPDTAFDFAKSYRFGMPFFIPVDYHDDRTQFND
ncbi:MAG: TonB-dependent receptor, partial [Acidobacteriota bacterium]